MAFMGVPCGPTFSSLVSFSAFEREWLRQNLTCRGQPSLQQVESINAFGVHQTRAVVLFSGLHLQAMPFDLKMF